MSRFAIDCVSVKHLVDLCCDLNYKLIMVKVFWVSFINEIMGGRNCIHQIVILIVQS